MTNKVIMIGCDPESPGGISSVVKTYENSGLFQSKKVKYISSYFSSNRLAVIFNFLVALMNLLISLVFQKVKVVHVHSASKGSFWRKYIMLRLAMLFGSKTIFHLHSGEFPAFFSRQSEKNKHRIRLFLEKVDAVIALTPYWQSKLLEIAPKSNVLVLLNPVDMIDEQCIKEERQILFLGRLRKEKGIYELLDAAKALSDNRVKFKLLLCGDGNIPEFKAFVEQHGLGNCIEFTGWVSGHNKDRLIKESDILVLPSYFEGLPISILEAMINDVTVVATDVGGIPDVVVNGETGLLVESKNSQALAKALEILLANKLLKNDLRKRAKEYAIQTFQTEKIIERLNTIYKQI